MSGERVACREIKIKYFRGAFSTMRGEIHTDPPPRHCHPAGKSCQIARLGVSTVKSLIVLASPVGIRIAKRAESDSVTVSSNIT